MINALLEREKMVNPRSRGEHPKSIVRFNSTLTLHGSLLAISFVNILDNVLAGEFASVLGNVEPKSAAPAPLSTEKRSTFYEARPKSL